MDEDLDISVVEEDSEDSDNSSSVSSDFFDDSNEREPLSDIDLYFIYINGENSIDKVEKMVESIDGSLNGLSKERLLQIVQTKRLCDDKKYRLNEIMAFQIPLEYVHLASFVKGDSEISDEFFQTVPIFNEVTIHPALYIFHDLTALYFFFSEAAKPLKSVLRNVAENRVTKKVRIADESIPYDIRKRKSLKRFFRRANSTRKVSETI